MPNPDPMEDTKVTFRVPGGTWDRVKSTRLSVWNADGGELFLEMNSQFIDGRGTLFHINGIIDLDKIICFEAIPASLSPVSVHVHCV
jgi:hypothetical protein